MLNSQSGKDPMRDQTRCAGGVQVQMSFSLNH